jgi:hypothetical protein
VEKWGQYGAATRWRVTWGPSAVLGWCCRPAAARPRREQAARACGRHRTGERRGLTGGPHYSPGQHGQRGVKLFKLFSNLKSSKTFGIKYGFEDLKKMNNFLLRNFFRFIRDLE